MKRSALGCAVAFGIGVVQFAVAQSQVVYTLEIGGDNHADLWEANQAPTFTKGVTSAPWPMICFSDPVTWAVRITVGGTHNGATGEGMYPLGAANLVFDLELYDESGLPVPIGAAPLVADGTQNVPADSGFWSSINDGDAAGLRGAGGVNADIEANAAFAISIHNQDFEPARRFSLIDPAPDGPGFDCGWYPTANGRGGVDIDGIRPIDYSINDPLLAGKLVGFGAGMKSYNYARYRPGVGKRFLSAAVHETGFGRYIDDADPANSDPLLPPRGVVEEVLFEGQICTQSLPPGTYTLKVKPSISSTNIIHGAVVWNSETPDYGGFGSFAVRANEVYPTEENNPGVKFELVHCWWSISVVGRYVFYNNSGFDRNNAGIDSAPIAGARNDDVDAIDPSKSPLLPGSGMATFANWTSYDKGINGLMFDVRQPVRAPVLSDFVFEDIGRLGTATPAVRIPSAFAVQNLGGGTTRVVVTFANGSIKNTWLRTTIGTGFGLAASDVSYWGHALGDSGTGNTAPNIQVTSTDEIAARDHRVFLPNHAAVDNPYDYNKNGNVTATDEILCRNNIVAFPFNSVKMIVR